MGHVVDSDGSYRDIESLRVLFLKYQMHILRPVSGFRLEPPVNAELSGKVRHKPTAKSLTLRGHPHTRGRGIAHNEEAQGLTRTMYAATLALWLGQTGRPPPDNNGLDK
jgi:hypothetical protein